MADTQHVGIEADVRVGKMLFVVTVFV